MKDVQSVPAARKYEQPLVGVVGGSASGWTAIRNKGQCRLNAVKIVEGSLLVEVGRKAAQGCFRGRAVPGNLYRVEGASYTTREGDCQVLRTGGK